MSPAVLIAVALAFASSNSLVKLLYVVSYSLILSWVFPVVSAFTSFAADSSSFVFWASVALSTNAALAFSNSAFLALTFVSASATCSGVESALLMIPSAAVTAASASRFAASYASVVDVVFPSVTFSAFANAFNSSLAVARSPVFALSFSNAVASANFAFNASTFAIASAASAFFALSCPAFVTKSAALAFASVNCDWIASTAFLYSAILAGVFVPTNELSSAGVNAASAFRNSATCSSVALSTSVALAASNFACTASTASCAFNAACSLALSPAVLIASAASIALSNSVFKLLYVVSYSLILSWVLPSVLAFTSFAADSSSFVFWASVALSTNAALAFSNSAFLALTFVSASATCSGVESALLMIPSAAVTAASASRFAASYASVVDVVFPSVTFSAFANAFNSSLAVARSPVFALSFSNAVASANFAFNASTFAIASAASAFFALSCPAFVTKSAALAFASVNCDWIASTAFLYSAILAGVFVPTNELSSAGVNAASAFRNSATCSSVALSTSVAFAASSFANTPSTASCAANASSLLALSPSVLIAAAFALAASNSVVSWSYSLLYALILSWVLPSVSAFTNFAASASNFVFWASVAATTNSALAAFNSANFSFSLLTAAATTSGSGLSWFNIFCASSRAFIASSFAVLYGSFEIGVLPILGSGVSFIKSNNLLFEVSNFVLSVRNAFWPSNTAFTISL